MPVDFESIIRDDKSWPDNLELYFNGTKVPLGAIRNLNKTERKQIADALGVIQQEREAVAKRQKEVADMATQATAIHHELQEQQKASRQQQVQERQQYESQQRDAANGGYDPEQVYQNDIWYGPIRKRGEGWDAAIKKNSEEIAQVVNVLKGIAGLYTDDRLDNEFAATAEQRKKSKSIGDWEFDKLRKYVEDNKIYDRRGFPSIKEAVTKLTAEERLQAEQEDAYARGLREGEMRARMGAMPRPAPGGAALTGKPAPSTMDEALSPESIQEDHELMEMLNNLGNVGQDLITGGKP